MARSLFRESFMGAPHARVSINVKPITLAVMSYEIPLDKIDEILKRAVPKGYVGTSPQVIKCIDGEFHLHADGAIEFTPLGRSTYRVK